MSGLSILLLVLGFYLALRHPPPPHHHQRSALRHLPPAPANRLERNLTDREVKESRISRYGGQGFQDIQVCRSRSPEYPGTEVKESRISRYGGQGVQDTQVWRSRSPGYPGMDNGGQGFQDIQVWRSRSLGYPGMEVKEFKISRYKVQRV